MLISVAVIIGAFFVSFSSKNGYVDYVGKTTTISGVVSNDPVYKKDDWRINLQTERGNIYVMVAEDLELKRSDELTLTGKIENGFGDYSAFVYRPKIEKVAHPNTADIALNVRDWFANRLQESLNDDGKSALALSYLTGQKSLLDETMQEKLRMVGLAHVVVASGYHLSIVVNLAKKRLGRISRFATLGGATLLLVIYISITGFSPSMTRAGLITFLSLLAWYFGRRFHPARSILYVAAISLIFEPNYITNLAWQLSFASYAGIMFLTPLFIKYFYGNDKTPNYFMNIIIASISAQLFCLPITIYHFGSLSGLAIIANIIVTPTIPIVMLMSFLSGITQFFPFVFVADKILAFQIASVDALANIPWATIDLPANNMAIFLFFVPILALLFWLKYRTKHSFRPSYDKI